jgi:hypothetical protein
MGPVDKGERMMERKGARISARDTDETSAIQQDFTGVHTYQRHVHIPRVLLKDLFSSSKPDIRSSSLLPCCGVERCWTLVFEVRGCLPGLSPWYKKFAYLMTIWNSFA